MSNGPAHYFEFLDWQYNYQSGRLVLNYHDSQFGQFNEYFQFPTISHERWQLIQQPLSEALNCLHWMAGVSYYKTSLAPSFKFANKLPNRAQATWLTETWQSGLAELAYENKMPWLDYIDFPSQKDNISISQPQQQLSLKPRSLVAIGGGKDSLVSIEALKAVSEDMNLFVVGQSEFIKSVAEQTSVPLLQVARQVDSRLRSANDQGAYNGHIPITAINSCVAVVAALLADYDSVVFSNERSADVGNVQDHQGRWVNHQYSKSFKFEQSWQAIIDHNITENLSYFSLLRPCSELSVIKCFSQLTHYFPHFSSCNRNFHLIGSQNDHHHWCGSCPKCAFVFLCLAPFVSRKQLITIFKKDLFSDPELYDLFLALLGVAGQKPFECVGEPHECRAALRLTAIHPDWAVDEQVANWMAQIDGFDTDDDKVLFHASLTHQIPSKRNFQRALNDAFK